MAIKFHLPNGEEFDMVTNSLKFFPVSNGADLFLAIAASPPDALKPTNLLARISKGAQRPLSRQILLLRMK
jgi:hypothetical protein